MIFIFFRYFSLIWYDKLILTISDMITQLKKKWEEHNPKQTKNKIKY